MSLSYTRRYNIENVRLQELVVLSLMWSLLLQLNVRILVRILSVLKCFIFLFLSEILSIFKYIFSIFIFTYSCVTWKLKYIKSDDWVWIMLLPLSLKIEQYLKQYTCVRQTTGVGVASSHNKYLVISVGRYLFYGSK